MMRAFLVTAAVVGCLAQSSPAGAGDWDLNLSRLCQIELNNGSKLDCGGGYTPSRGQVKRVIPDDPSFRALMSELGVVFAPNMLSPASTQGYNGFNFAVEMGWTMVNPKGAVRTQSLEVDPIGYDRRYWRAAKGVSPAAFASGDISSKDAQVARDRIDREMPGPFAPTVTIMARKGLWIPVPSFELAVGVRHLIGSRMWGPLVQAKLALHEGFQGWPVPAVSVRGSGTRVVGTPDFNLTIAGLDFAISKHFGIASTFNLTPYVGYQLLWIIADSEVLDATPIVDSMEQTKQAVGGDPLKMNRCGVQDCLGNFTFEDQPDILRHRVFFGLKLNFYIASLLLEYSLFTSGSKAGETVSQYTGLALDYDAAGTQHNIALSVALDY